MIDEIPQAEVQPQSSRGGVLPMVLAIVMAAYIAVSGYFLYSMHQDLAAVRAKQQTQDSELRGQIASVRSDARASSAALANQLGMTQKQLDARSAALHREQKEAEERLAEQEQQRVAAVTGEVAGVKTEVGTVKNDVATARADLEATRAKLERAIGDLGIQSGLIATTRSDLEILKHKGDRNYYDFTLTRNSKRMPVGTISLELKKTDPKKGKYTLNVLADDRTIEKKDRNLNEPIQFYSGRDHFLFELVVFSIDKDKVTGYLSTPKSAPTPVAANVRSD
jgi:hypothetical protein